MKFSEKIFCKSKRYKIKLIFIDLDSNSVNYGKKEYIERRGTFLEFVKKKQLENIKKVLIHYNVFTNIEIHDKWTLVNAYCDICNAGVATQLLLQKEFEK